MIMTAAAAAVVTDAGADVLTLIEGIEEADFTRSRLTRMEVRRRLRRIADALAALAGLDGKAQARMPELDWSAWAAVADALQQEGAESDATAWFAARSLVPATLMWLQVYRKSEPSLFEFRP